ncbi:MAG: HigA family addiction module antitoxin [Rhodospirillales bacterium]|jgi:addiction module HigA family antidote|nr:HigA family addiction module antitoxin [Rhodospirillales bacterium]HIJ44530.1 HigA family addiction module antidote protein [Rhodospirillaceae bacterium]MDP7216464.1 HigA family addiction module antitoxin [Rhodospirillales bacterium]HIJ46251.1 HigA family addiction module antidote protein [Rhodospirillaceae bacterium]HIJ93444.1 HigA family addiction module antidote protein [Rhodospirillaceae bacterium]
MRIPTHPGDILKRELETIGLSAHALSMALGVPASRIDQIVKCRRAVTSDTALRLAAYFGGSPMFWLNMQTAHDLAVAEKEHGKDIRRVVKARAA